MGKAQYKALYGTTVNMGIIHVNAGFFFFSIF